MKKQKTIICILLFLLIIVGVFSGCSKNEPVKLKDSADQIQGMEEYEPSGTLSKSFSENVVYEVTDIFWGGEIGTAEVKVTTPDMARIIAESIERAIDEYGVEDYNVLLNKVREYVQNMLNSDNCPMIDSIVEMDAIKIEEGFRLISNEKFERIITGNLEEVFIKTLMEGFANENSDY